MDASGGNDDAIDPDGPPDGVMLEDDEELLWRQVPPSWCDEEGPSSQAFRPTSKDRKRLSTARGSMISAQDAFQRHVDNGGQSSGSWAVSTGEARFATVPAWWDGGRTQGLPADHASLYFGGKSRGQQETASKVLRARAHERGCQFMP
jgi:hypothetical protein